jgi:outer membrane protein OmpA-like peptidoglycan-associated protein
MPATARRSADYGNRYMALRLAPLAAALMLAACSSPPRTITHLSQPAETTTHAGQLWRDTGKAERPTDEPRHRIEEGPAKPVEDALVPMPGGILFDRGSWELKAGTHAQLDRLAAFLARSPERSVIIEGHTDNAEGASLELSQRRAEAVRSYLVRQGISPVRLFTAASGQQFPVADNRTASGRQENRRVEFLITDTRITVR